MITIPAINATDFETVKKQILTAAKFSDWVHIDVVDGKFSPNVTWGNPDDILKIKNQSASWRIKINIEIHLMVNNPENVIESWLKSGLVKRLIIHLESIRDSVYILETCRKYGAEAMLAANPETGAEKLSAHKDFKYFQFLAVSPGKAGQKFKLEILAKIGFLRKKFPDAKIEVDGGINLETAGWCKKAGADIVASASYIFGSEDPKKAYQKLVSV